MTMLGELPDAEVIDLEPTMPVGGAVGSEPEGPGAGVELVEGSGVTLGRETHELRRRRLGAASVFLAVSAAAVFAWNLLDHPGESLMLVLGTIGLRSALAAGVAALLLGRIRLTRGQVRGLEYLLFGGFTLLMGVNQYVSNLDLLRHGDIIGVIASVKNGTAGTVLLMIVYGMFVPNHPRTTAKVVLTMALTMVASLVLVLEHPDVWDVVERIRSAEHAGSNILFLAIGAGLAIYGSYILNGLRAELHEARKFGQYQLGRKLGEGGMGEVYLAEHQLLKRPCALKRIRPEAGADPLALARFEREVRSSARLSHHNTIEIYDYGHTDDGTFYYVMEYLRGMSLADLIRSYGPLPPGRVIYLFRQVCAGLAEAHGLGLIHRDLKPANVFVAVVGGESDVAKVLDFGLVKLTKDEGAAELTSELTVSGTPLYMAPEQATGDRSLDARADIYALGAMMYTALTGRTPFRGETAFAVMMAHSRDPVVPPSEVRPGIPEDLERVVLICLAKSPGERFHDVKALARALASCSSASEWDADRADRWWADALPPRPGADTPSPRPAGQVA